MKLYINEDVIIVNNNFEKIIFMYDRSNRNKYEINEDMFEILEYIYNNEGISTEELYNYYADIEEIVLELIELQILKSLKQKRCHNIKKIITKNYARLFVELTDKCNLRCKHCYGDFKLENASTLSINDLDNLIDQAVELNIYQFDLTGGEPLLYQELDKLLLKLYNAGMLVTIFTNLVVSNDKVYDLIEKYKVKKIITSIDSNIEEVHDNFRGMNGALNRTLCNVEKLKATNIELSVNTMVGKHNEENIVETIEFLKKINVPCVLDAIIPNGRGDELNEDTFKSVQTIHDLYRHKDLNVELKITDCGVGVRFMYIKSNGNVCLCPSLTDNDFTFGNITEEKFSLNESWNKMSNKYGQLSCDEKCTKRELCNGGCRARALIFKNNLYKRDLNSCILCGECSYDKIK